MRNGDSYPGCIEPDRSDTRCDGTRVYGFGLRTGVAEMAERDRRGGDYSRNTRYIRAADFLAFEIGNKDYSLAV